MTIRQSSLVILALALSACATAPNNPNYQQSTKYKVSSPTQYASAPSASTTTQASYSSYSAPTTQAQTTYAQATSAPTSASYTRVNHECLNKESNRQLIGAAVGGTAGALIGKEVVGGTTGTVIGAGIGGVAGYGIGDASINCDPVNVPITQQTATVSPAYTTTTTPEPYTTYASSQPQVISPYTHTSANDPAPSSSTSETAGKEVELKSTTVAPTDQAYGELFGTPGYHAVQPVDENTQIAIIPVRPKYYTSSPSTSGSTIAEQSSAPATSSYGAPQPVQAPSQQYADRTYSSTMSSGTGTQHLVVEGDTVYSLSRKLCVEVEDIQRLNSLDGQFSIKLDQYITLPPSRC